MEDNFPRRPKVQHSPKDHKYCKCREDDWYSIFVPYCHNIFLELAFHLAISRKPERGYEFIPATSKGSQDLKIQDSCAILNGRWNLV
jgi:hypothetical protein